MRRGGHQLVCSDRTSETVHPRDSSPSHGARPAGELPWLISMINSLHPIAFSHPDTVYLLMSASHRTSLSEKSHQHCVSSVLSTSTYEYAMYVACWPHIKLT